MFKRTKRWIKNAYSGSIKTKLISLYTLMVIIVFIVIVLVFYFINVSLKSINNVYSSNITMGELSTAIQNIQYNLYGYLNTRNAESLENYYRYEDEYRNMLGNLNDKNMDDEIFMLQKNIRGMSETYLKLSEMTIQEKRGRNVEKYKDYYEKSTEIYNYIKEYISLLNESQFEENSSNYMVLLGSLKLSEFVSVVIIALICILSMTVLLLFVRNIINPLVSLARTADEIASGNLEAELKDSELTDEVGIVTNAFNTMVRSLRHYVDQVKKRMEEERKLKEQQLLMENHLKDARLKYLQAQINPHFLFNCLNAGAQLAMLEDAERTSVFVQKMADFFRYNVKKMQDDATLEEEIEVVDNYIYIINVRYDGEIHYEKHIGIEDIRIRVPSMILQPIVENALNHGVRNNEGEKRIALYIVDNDDDIIIQVQDNGEGMEREKVQEIMENIKNEEQSDSDSTGIGLENVNKRLELYYKKENLFKIDSDGAMCGTTATIIIPKEEEVF